MNKKNVVRVENLLREIQEGRFSFEKDRYPPDERFARIQKPVTLTSLDTGRINELWTQIPFSGSLIIILQIFPQNIFEEYVCKVSEIPKIIDFIKETGRLQIALSDPPTKYEGLDYLTHFLRN